jgi:prephenate dehydrogenase
MDMDVNEQNRGSTAYTMMARLLRMNTKMWNDITEILLKLVLNTITRYSSFLHQ